MTQKHREQNAVAGRSHDSDIVYRSTWRGELNSPAIATVTAVADVEGLTTTEVPVLADVVDPDVLDALFDERNDKLVDSVSFQYSGYTVTLTQEGSVKLQ